MISMSACLIHNYINGTPLHYSLALTNSRLELAARNSLAFHSMRSFSQMLYAASHLNRTEPPKTDSTRGLHTLLFRRSHSRIFSQDLGQPSSLYLENHSKRGGEPRCFSKERCMQMLYVFYTIPFLGRNLPYFISKIYNYF
jgi:hypothetical protein